MAIIITDPELGRLTGNFMRSRLLAEYYRRDAIQAFVPFIDPTDHITKQAIVRVCRIQHPDAHWLLQHKRPYPQLTPVEYWTGVLGADIQRARTMLLQDVSIPHY
ncbi:MAG: hypothetical protein NVSMB49_22800 [Ktedonobacteraceae bacterium]